MKKFLMILCAMALVSGLVGNANAISYYEAYTGDQFISENTTDYWFEFDIDVAGNGATNSSLAFTNDAVGFEWYNNEQLDSVQIALDLYSIDCQPELFDLDVDIYWSRRDFTETVSFNANSNNGVNYYYTYDFTQRQIDGWENGGWGLVTIDAYNIRGRNNFNDFIINRVAFTAENKDNVPNAPVPEPATLLLMGFGILGLMGLRRSKKS